MKATPVGHGGHDAERQLLGPGNTSTGAQGFNAMPLPARDRHREASRRTKTTGNHALRSAAGTDAKSGSQAAMHRRVGGRTRPHDGGGSCSDQAVTPTQQR